ncbi:hypothetical protein CIB48_g10499 [Xylaria polymorpha]|nr:hypothetical protein CIB48_g10499 [Xylaria polymorpha]
MHELFLTASVKQGDFDTACAVLQGLSWMTARRTICRVLFVRGAAAAQGPGGDAAAAERAAARRPAPLERAPQAAPALLDSPMDFARLPATLRWTDLPDPLRDSPITSEEEDRGPVSE